MPLKVLQAVIVWWHSPASTKANKLREPRQRHDLLAVVGAGDDEHTFNFPKWWTISEICCWPHFHVLEPPFHPHTSQGKKHHTRAFFALCHPLMRLLPHRRKTCLHVILWALSLSLYTEKGNSGKWARYLALKDLPGCYVNGWPPSHTLPRFHVGHFVTASTLEHVPCR